jgi:hypothetical protein
MHCPFCFAVDTKVIDSRLVGKALPCVAVGSVWSVMNVYHLRSGGAGDAAGGEE